MSLSFDAIGWVFPSGTSLAHTDGIPQAASGGGNKITNQYHTEYEQSERIVASLLSAIMVYDLIREPAPAWSHETDGMLTKPDAFDFQ